MAVIIKYDRQSGYWLASAIIDGQPVVCINRDMRQAMAALATLQLGPPVLDCVCVGGFVADTDTSVHSEPFNHSPHKGQMEEADKRNLS